MELNVIAYYKSTDKFGRLHVQLLKSEREKLERIEGTYMVYYLNNNIEYKSPLNGGKLRVNVPDKDLIYLGDGDSLERDDKLKLRLKLRKYNYNGNIGYVYKLLSATII
jgi:hypothetical protein